MTTLVRSLPRARRWATRAAALALGAGLAAGLAAAPAHAQASSTRDVVINDFETEHTVDECTGEFGTLNRTFTGFAHTTVRPDGNIHFNALLSAADVTFVPDDHSLPVYSGKELVHVSDTTNGSNATMTFVVRIWADATDGRVVSVMDVEHLSISADGHVVDFEKPVLVCR
jgi:hypothetical protein